MARRFINELGEREDIDDVFLASDKQLRPIATATCICSCGFRIARAASTR